MSLFSSSKPMDSSTKHTHHTQTFPQHECDAIVVPTTKLASSCRTPSISSSSSSSCSSSNFPDESPLSPATPLRFSGVPFSWEHMPGIPKKLSSHHHHHRKNKKDTALTEVLPLPPHAAIPKRFNTLEEIGTRKKNSNYDHQSYGSNNKDPFLVALYECSKDEGNDDGGSNFWHGGKISRSISDRFGFINLYSSCKRTCAVSQSIVYLPRSNRSAYDLIPRRSG